MIELPTRSPDSPVWYKWFQKFVNESKVKLTILDSRLEFYTQVNNNLANYNAKLVVREGNHPVVVFENEQDATLFLMKWS